jgi:sugar lactone lactonase YvrE
MRRRGAGLKPERLLLGAAAFSAALGACNDQDLTLTQPLANSIPLLDAGETPSAPSLAPPLSSDAGLRDPQPATQRDAGGDPVAVGTPEPLVPVAPPPDGKDPKPPAAFDCSTVPEVPVAFEVLEGFTSSEDFAFDAQGNYVGVDEDYNLVRIAKTGEKQLWAPSIGGTAGMAMLPDGSLVFCALTDGAVKRVYPNGAVVVVLGGLLYPNGLDVGPDGFIYVAENAAGRVRRVNPDTGEFSIVAHGLDGPNGVAFSDDPHLLYVGSFEGSGVYQIVLGDPEQSGQVSVFARPANSELREQELVCADLVEGADCTTDYVPEGRCEVLANVVDCMPVDPCIHLEDGEGCYHPSAGICRASRCEPVAPACQGLSEGDACDDPFTGPGVCKDYDSPALYCEAPNPCAGLQPGDVCEDRYTGPGTCEGIEGELYCYLPNPCVGAQDGDACEDPYSGAGTCQGAEGERYCYPPGPCDDLRDGDACEDPYFGTGVCESAFGYRYCTLVNPCAGLSEGAACEDDFYGISNGRCGFPPEVEQPPFFEALIGGEVVPAPVEGSVELDAGAPVGEGPPAADAGSPPPPVLVCLPPNQCLGQPDGTRCDDAYLGGRGTCDAEICVVHTGPGGIDGLGVDACGNVYASEYISGRVWRVSPAGEVELLATLPSVWIPNIKWGRDVGGFSSSVMYVADREQSRLFGIQVGVAGAKEFFATVP